MSCFGWLLAALIAIVVVVLTYVARGVGADRVASLLFGRRTRR